MICCVYEGAAEMIIYRSDHEGSLLNNVLEQGWT